MKANTLAFSILNAPAHPLKYYLADHLCPVFLDDDFRRYFHLTKDITHQIVIMISLQRQLAMIGYLECYATNFRHNDTIFRPKRHAGSNQREKLV